MRYFIILFVAFSVSQLTYDDAFCQQNKVKLSDKTEVSIVTMGPDINELYATFGHTLIRINDPNNGIDCVYNFGVFDFNQPNFYINFARGSLLYMAGKYLTKDAFNYYQNNNQSISYINLNLLQEEKQTLFMLLENYLLPENKHYYYDYFFNNCSTKVRDVLEEALAKTGVTIEYDYSLLLKTENTIGEMVRKAAINLPWGTLSIDMCLGATMEKILSNKEYSFLPEYLEKSWMTAKLNNPNRSLTDERIVYFKSQKTSVKNSFFTPMVVGWSIFLITLIITIFNYIKRSHSGIYDTLLFGSVGILGIILSSIWLFTNHTAAKYNLDVLWALPIHIFTAFILFKAKYGRFIKSYLVVISIIYIFLLISWAFLPQFLDRAFIPIVMSLTIRIIYFLFNKESLFRC